MKRQLAYLNVFILLIFTSCGGSGGEASSSCGPTPLTGVFSNLAANKGIQMANCTFSYLNAISGCVISGSYPYTSTAFGSLAVTITSSSNCGTLPSATSCTFAISSSNQIFLDCPALSINDTFYRQ